MTLRSPFNPFTRWFLVAITIIVFSLLADLSRVMLHYSRAEHLHTAAFSLTQALRLITEPFVRADSAYFKPTASIKAVDIVSLPG